MDMLSFAERLKKLRKLHNKLQREVAELLGVTERHYRLCETGRVDLPSSKLHKLARYFNVSLDYLVGDTEEPFRYAMNSGDGNFLDEPDGETAKLLEAQEKGFIIPKVGNGVDVFTHLMALVIQNMQLVKDFDAVIDCIDEMRDFSPNEENRDEFWVKLHRFMRMTKDIRPIVIPLLPRLLKNEGISS